DQWFFSFQFLNEYHAHVDGQMGATTSFSDRPEHWNPLLTLSGSGFFVHQKLRPLWAVAYEVDGGGFPLFLMQADWAFNQRFGVRVGEIIYAGSSHNQVNSLLNYYSDRDTAYIKFT